MSDFDRELAKTIGLAASKTGNTNRLLISSYYQQVSTLLGCVESNEVFKKWIDFLVHKLSSLNVVGRKSKQIAKLVFDKIAKT